SAQAGLALILLDQKDLSAARKLQEEILSFRRRTLPDDHPSLLSAKADLALTLRAQGDLSEARKFLEEAANGRRQQLGEHHPDTSAAEWELARTLKQLRDTAAMGPDLERLRWLIGAAEAGLSAEQKKIARELPALLPK